MFGISIVKTKRLRKLQYLSDNFLLILEKKDNIILALSQELINNQNCNNMEHLGKCMPVNRKEAVLIRAKLLNEINSEKAYLVETDDGKMWIPKHQSCRPNDKGTMAVTLEYFERKLKGKKGYEHSIK